MKAEELVLDKSQFVFANEGEQIHDKELATKPVGYFKDAMNRFMRNKGSIVAFFIIIFLFLFALVGPLLTPYKVSDSDTQMGFCLPKSRLFSKMGFWDGTQKKETQALNYYYYKAMGDEYEIMAQNLEKNGDKDTAKKVLKNAHYAIKGKIKDVEKLNAKGKKEKYYQYKLDTYNKTGVIFLNVQAGEYNNIQKYQNKTGKQVILPITDLELRPESTKDKNDGNFWYQTESKNGGKTYPKLDSNGNFVNIYKKYDEQDAYLSVRIEGETPLYNYSRITQSGYEIRVNYYEYYVYTHTYVKNDKIKSPVFLFGSDAMGRDIFTCLSSGARLSFLLAISISIVNLFIGAIYGAIEGYYGGKIDLMMERFIDILGNIPFMIVVTLLKFHMGGKSQVLILFISFFLTGWVGMAGRTRMQFYRFKNQEYVLAARTLGASDARIMLKHIFPNAIGTLITGSVLVIPSFIFSESNLSYLGIINLSTGKHTSVGTLLASGQPYLSTHPYMILFPALFISLLMLSFNLFGNGLRDAFNPSLRGAED